MTSHPLGSNQPHDLESPAMFEVIARVYRGRNERGELVQPQIESVHLGIVAVVDENGNILLSKGNIRYKTYIRSAAKPFQILPLLASGAADRFGLTPKELAVICGSHNGEQAHVQAVRSILEKASLNETHLQCGTQVPAHRPTAEEMMRKGETFGAVHNNCSGKHAGMLAFCVHKGLSVEDYLDFDHPLQVEIKQYVEKYSGSTNVFCGTDGCSAPVFYLELYEMARMFGCLASRNDELLARSFEIMRAEPYMIGGRDRFDTDLIANSSVVSKVGGEGVECVAVPADGDRKAMGMAVKVLDGDFRALYPVVTGLLTKFGALNEEQLRSLQKYYRTPLRNHRKKEVGFIESAI